MWRIGLNVALFIATCGGEVTISEDLVMDTAVYVTNDITVNLNANISIPNDTVGDGVFCVKQGTLTLNGNGIVDGVGNNGYCMVLWADGGDIVINGGTYTNVGASSAYNYDQFDLIYVKNGSTVTINGGIFMSETPEWTLNCHNNTAASIVITGGSFYKFDPSNLPEYVRNDNITIADGYKVIQDGDWYTVVADSDIAVVTNENELRNALYGDAKKVVFGADIVLQDSIIIEDDVVIDLNGYAWDSSANDSRPINVAGNASLTIEATGSNVKVGKFGLVNIVAGSNATVTLNGGTYIADEDSDNGAFIKVRPSATANIALNNVTYLDNTKENYVVNADDASAALTVTGGSYKGKGFQATASSTFTNVTIETTLNTCIEVCASRVGGTLIENTTVISGCTFTAPASAWGCVTISYNGSAVVTNSTIVSGTGYAKLSGNGSITVDGVAVC